MIPEVLLVVLCAAAEPAADKPVLEEKPAETKQSLKAPPAKEIDESALQSHRTAFEALSERMIGTASRAVRYDWRKMNLGIAATASQLLELNNFNSVRVGGGLRFPLSELMVEFAAFYVHTWGSEATERLSFTPYRQAGRPSRLEIDLNVGFPLAEGVSTPRFGFLPATELVFSVNAGIRYLYYPGSLNGFDGWRAFGALFAPSMDDDQIKNLEPQRLPGMGIDRTRYNLLVGFSLDVYFQTGVFLGPRVMLALPVFSGFTGSGLGVWWELTMSAGWSF